MIKINNNDRINEFAKGHGYNNAIYVGDTKQGRIYEAIYDSDAEISIIGLPAFIIDLNGELEWIQDERSFEILEMLI